MRHLLLSAALLCGSCALGPGEPMGTVTGATLSAQYALRPERDAGDGFQRLANDYEVRVTRAEATLAPVALVEAASAGGGGVFDPANPPAGYTNCHSGHCHTADGRLVDYADIEAELAGGGGTQARTALSLQPTQETVDLLAQASPQPLSCAPSCTLSEGDIHAVHVPVRRLVLEGEVRDGRSSPRFAGTRAFSFLLETAAEGAPLPVESEVELPVDRDSPPHLALALSLAPGAYLFDTVDFAALAAATPGPLSLTGSDNTTAWDQVVDALGEHSLSVDVSRSTP